MNTSAIRQQIHKLLDEANEHQLDAVLEILTQHTSRYTQEEINSFYNRVKLFEERGSKGSSVMEAHGNIRSKYNSKNYVIK
jgi:hypothetical protein